MTERLFATDLDGTLLDRTGNVSERDREAIRAAMARGVVVTIATGRLTSGTHPIARSLDLVAPIVCADGGVMSCGETLAVLHRDAMQKSDVEQVLGAFTEAGLASFVFTDESIHSCERGLPHHTYVRGWAPDIRTHADILATPAWRAHETVMLAGIGPPENVRHVARSFTESLPILDSITFGIGPDVGVVRFIARGVNKGTGLARVASRLGVERAHVGVVGDWLNDLPMFEWAGRSFAMSHAPDDVKERATETLSHGGGVAEALERFLAVD